MMCGICGQLNFAPPRPVDLQDLETMNRTLRHRGPDGEGFYRGNGMGLAMCRLAIIDLPTGGQPISNEDGSVWTVLNGEIYNYRELRADLEARGHVLRTRSDTETLVHLYEEFGCDCVARLRGMFAFAVWDEKRRRLLLARDRIGVKPLYYTIVDGSLLFASEIKALLARPGVPRNIRLDAIHHYLTLQYVPDPMTAFEGIWKLPPAHRLIWEDGELTVERYWDFGYEPKHRGSEADLAAELRERLEEAVRIRMLSDVPLGVHLSGGIDSSVVAALASRSAPGRLKTFSIGFAEERFSELPYARAVSDMYATDHHEFTVTYDNLPALLHDIASYFDEPLADPSAVPVHHLCRLTRQHVTVALNGDGGDELFAGYPRYRLDAVAGVYGRLPSWITQRAVPAALSAVPQPMDRPGERNWIAGLKRLEQALRISPKSNMVRWGSYFDEAAKRQLWKSEILNGQRFTDTAALVGAAYDAARAEGHLDRTLYADCVTYLPGDLLVKADRMSMAHSLEARSPFLDQELVAWVARLPEKFKLAGSVHKVLLKSACRDLLPATIRERGKQGFGIPAGAWIRGPLNTWVRERLLSPGAAVLGLFSREAIARLLREHERGHVNHGNRLWALLMLELWIEAHVDV